MGSLSTSSSEVDAVCEKRYKTKNAATTAAVEPAVGSATVERMKKITGGFYDIVFGAGIVPDVTRR